MAYNRVVRFKTGLLVGLAVGYYYGAKAGRERYLQIDHYLEQVRASDAFQAVRGQFADVLDDTIGRARQVVNGVAFGGASPSSGHRPVPYDYTGDPTLN